MTAPATSHTTAAINITVEANNTNHAPAIEEKLYQQALISLNNLTQELKEKSVFENCMANPPAELKLSRPNLVSRLEQYKEQNPGKPVPTRQACNFTYQDTFELSKHFKDFNQHFEQYVLEWEERVLQEGAAKKNVPVENLSEEDRKTILKNADKTKQHFILGKMQNLYTQH